MKRFVATLFALGMLLNRQAAEAAVLAIDSAKSSITLSGNILGTAIQEQGPGSLTTHFAGSIRFETTPASITFPGGSVVDAITNGVWAPNGGGGSGSAPADFAGEARSFLATVKGAFRNLVLDVTSGALPLANGEFDASALVFAFPTTATASLDYDLGLFKDALPLTGVATNKVTKAGSFKTENGRATLTIEVNTEYAFAALSAGEAFVRLSGQLVAVEGNAWRIESISRGDRTVRITVPGTASSLQVQGTTDFITWSAVPATRIVENGATAFDLDVGDGPMFFRAVQ
jgi:hypothetical protein